MNEYKNINEEDMEIYQKNLSHMCEEERDEILRDIDENGLENNDFLDEFDTQKIIKLDYESPIEEVFNYGAIFGFIAALISIFVYFKHKQVIASYVAGGVLIFAIFCWISRKFIDCYWYLDIQKREIHYYGKYFIIENDLLYGKFNDIAGASVDCCYYSSKSSSYWSYCLILLLKKGSILKISDFKQEEFASTHNQAQKIARKLNIEYFQVPKETRIRKIYDNQRGHYVLIPRIGIWNFIGTVQWTSVLVIGYIIYVLYKAFIS